MFHLMFFSALGFFSGIAFAFIITTNPYPKIREKRRYEEKAKLKSKEVYKKWADNYLYIVRCCKSLDVGVVSYISYLIATKDR